MKIQRQIFVLLCVTFFACSSSKKISSRFIQINYSKQQFSPQFLVWHFLKDSTRIYIRTEKESEWRIEYKYFADEAGKIIIDSTVVNFNRVHFLKKNVFFFHLASTIGEKNLLELKITDLRNNESKTDFIFIDRNNPYSRQNFMALDVEENIPLFKNYVGDEKVTLRYFNIEHLSEKISVKRFKNIFEPSPPVFADQKSKKFEFVADSIFTVSMMDTLTLEKEGFYHFQTAENKEGWTLFRFHDDFPKITPPAKMAECARYISKTSEFDIMNQSRDQQVSLDSFWMKLGGEKEKAKLLIKEYYSRIQFANSNFTSYKAGWQTDRGMVYAIYGKPDTVYKYPRGENWLYNKTATEAMTNFYFQKVENTFSDNHFYLIRNVLYENSWNIATHKWRHGRTNEIIK